MLRNNPPPEIVTVADLLEMDVLSLVAVTVTPWLPDPLVGETVSQEASSTMFQLTFEVISNVPELPDEFPIKTVVGTTVNSGCKTVVNCQTVPVVVPEEFTGSILQ